MQDIFESIFLKILNMSMTASYIILAVIIVRLLLKKAPKKYSYALWAVALFRLICPVSFKSVISIFALKPFAIRMKDSVLGSQGSEIVHIPENIGMMTQPEIQTGIPAVDPVINSSLPAATPMYSANPMQIWEFFGMLLWLVGIAMLVTISAVSLIKLHRRLRTATQLEGDVWQSENVRSPFIVGLFRPKIYIPYGLDERQLGHVLAHERAHIKRLDHVVRSLAYLILCLHWFNPLVWIAFYLMGKDMELSCDEKVLGKTADKAEYSETLLSFAAPRRFPTPTPLAFGESGVAQRIKNALKWKKPHLWVSIIALILCLVVIAACAANPKMQDDGWELKGRWVPVKCVYKSPDYSYNPFGGDDGNIYDINEDGLCILDHQSGEWRGGYGPIREWQDFPYSDKEWEEMFLMYDSSFSHPISKLYDEILYMPLIGNDTGEPIKESEAEADRFFLGVDGELWFVSTSKDSNGKRLISSIYALVAQESLGQASFEYDPEQSSNEQGIEIRFAGDFDEIGIDAISYKGTICAYVNGERYTQMDSSIFVPSDGSLFWSPVQGAWERPDPYGLAKTAVLRLIADLGDSSARCSIYISFKDGVYTLSPVGEGVHLSQSGNNTAVLSFGRSYPDAAASFSIPRELLELLAGLDPEKNKAESGLNLGHEKHKEEVSRLLIEALKSVNPNELVKGRGSPWQHSVTIGTDDGELTIGYSALTVDLQLSTGLREKYNLPAGVWEIHNNELISLMRDLDPFDTSGEYTFEMAEDGSGPVPAKIYFNFPDADMIDISVTSESTSADGKEKFSSSYSETLFESDKAFEWLPDVKDGIIADTADIRFTVWQGDEHNQGQLYLVLKEEDTDRPTYYVEPEGIFAWEYYGEEKETMAIIKPNKQNYRKNLPLILSNMKAEDIFHLFISVGQKYIEVDDAITGRIVEALNSISRSEMSIRDTNWGGHDILIRMETLEGNLMIAHKGEKTQFFLFDSLMQEPYEPTNYQWVADNQKMNELFELLASE